jgi:NAD(P)H-dependent flavin oxidoreductase YrpB (nitropropane dioxygenase family)
MTTRFDTPFTRLLGIDVPVVQAPIGGLSTPALAAAVSNAGGLGTLSVTWREPGRLREMLAETRRLTDRPWGVNLVLEWPPEERLAICLDGGARLISFFWGDPAPYVARVHAAGALVSYTVGSAAEATRAVAAGVDVIVAQGWEAGGHVWGQVGTLALVPHVADAVAPAPVLAAGGIVDGRGLAAALTLGAAGVWMGTRFLLSEEASVHPLYRQRVIDAVETDTIHTELFDGGWPNAPLRALRNHTVALWEAAGEPPPGKRPGEGEIVGNNELGEPVPRYSSSAPTAGATGAVEEMVMYAGQGVGLVDRVQPAGEIVRELADEAVRELDRVRRMAQVAAATGAVTSN